MNEKKNNVYEKSSRNFMLLAAFNINSSCYQHWTIRKRVFFCRKQNGRPRGNRFAEGRTFQPIVDVEKGFLIVIRLSDTRFRCRCASRLLSSPFAELKLIKFSLSAFEATRSSAQFGF